MKLYVIRHGQSENNVKGLCDCDPKIKTPLTKKGANQAKLASSKLKSKSFDIIFASELFRAQKTAEIINKNHQLEVIIDKRLNDRYSGFHGKPVSDFFNALNKSNNFWEFKFPRGESFEEEKERVFDFLNSLKQMNYKSVLTVTHEEAMRIISGFFNKLTNDKMWNIKIDNCQVLEFQL